MQQFFSAVHTFLLFLQVRNLLQFQLMYHEESLWHFSPVKVEVIHLHQRRDKEWLSQNSFSEHSPHPPHNQDLHRLNMWLSCFLFQGTWRHLFPLSSSRQTKVLHYKTTSKSTFQSEVHKLFLRGRMIFEVSTKWLGCNTSFIKWICDQILVPSFSGAVYIF